jgi:hypothetical protein
MELSSARVGIYRVYRTRGVITYEQCGSVFPPWAVLTAEYLEIVIMYSGEQIRTYDSYKLLQCFYVLSALEQL